MEGFSSTPVLLMARLWSISGNLQGPNGEIESGEWTILEDPWSKTISPLNGPQSLQHAPVLRSIEPPVGNWITPERINEELAKVIGERRRGKDTGEGTGGGREGKEEEGGRAGDWLHRLYLRRPRSI